MWSRLDSPGEPIGLKAVSRSGYRFAVVVGVSFVLNPPTSSTVIGNRRFSPCLIFFTRFSAFFPALRLRVVEPSSALIVALGLPE